MDRKSEMRRNRRPIWEATGAFIYARATWAYGLGLKEKPAQPDPFTRTTGFNDNRNLLSCLFVVELNESSTCCTNMQSSYS
jgi:hypothetical protein